MNTFTEELWEKYTIENENGTDVMFAEMFMDAIKAYQSHLISEGEKMKYKEIQDDEAYGYNTAITAYQAIIRDTNHL